MSAAVGPGARGCSGRNEWRGPCRYPPTPGPQRTQGVPAARLPRLPVHRDRDAARVRVLDHPATVGPAGGPDDRDRLGRPRVRVGACGAQVVEAPQDVVVPVRREREPQPPVVDQLTGREAVEQSPLQQVLLAAAPGGGRRGGAPGGPLVLQHALEHRDRGVERRPGGPTLGLAVPAAVLELLGEQPVDDPLHLLPEGRTDRERQAVDARLDLAREERLAVVLPPAVRVHRRDRATGLRARRVETEQPQQLQAPRGRGPRLARAGEVGRSR